MQMGIDREKLFNEASLLICGNLDFGQALEQVRDYLADVLPLDGLFFNLYQKDKRAMRTILCSTEAVGQRKNLITPLTDQAVDALESVFSTSKGKIKTFSDPNETIMGALEAPILGYEGRAGMSMRLQVDSQYLGTLVASATPGMKFSEEDLDLIASLNKPFTVALLNAMAHEEIVSLKDRLVDDNNFLQQELYRRSGDVIIGTERGLKTVMTLVNQVASLSNTVLLMGETGTGKELIANIIHSVSPRCNGPLIKVNCGAIPDNLIDSELFGYEKGAFTGATTRKRGRFERAHGGTIFLDEIGELPPAAQVRLLRVLQTKEIERVGGSEPIKVDIRVIAATHRDLDRMVVENTFREDLLFRINVFPITLPPLRRRKEDLPQLVDHFIGKKAQEMKLHKVPDVAERALASLVSYDWPGNVRELENVIERALILNQGSPLELDPFAFAPTSETTKAADVEEVGSTASSTEMARQEDDAVRGGDGQLLSLDETIAHQIRKTLQLTRGKVGGKGGAADLLGINSSTLRNRMNKLGIKYGKKVEE